MLNISLLRCLPRSRSLARVGPRTPMDSSYRHIRTTTLSDRSLRDLHIPGPPRTSTVLPVSAWVVRNAFQNSHSWTSSHRSDPRGLAIVAPGPSRAAASDPACRARTIPWWVRRRWSLNGFDYHFVVRRPPALIIRTITACCSTSGFADCNGTNKPSLLLQFMAAYRGLAHTEDRR